MSEKEVTYRYRRDYSRKVRPKSAGYGMTCISDANTSEIHCEHIECGVGASLEDAAQATDEGVRAVCSHSVNHHSPCTAPRQRFHQSRWQSPDKVSVASNRLYSPFHSPDKPIHSSRGAEYSDAHEDSHKVGDDSNGSLESVLGTLDECVIYIHFFSHASQDESYNDSLYLFHLSLCYLVLCPSLHMINRECCLCYRE